MRAFPETEACAAPVEQINEELDTVREERRRRATVRTRARLRLAAHKADPAIRRAAHLIEAADGGRKGPLFEACFPDGVGEVTAPAGSRQIAPLQQLIGRVKNCRLPGAEQLAAEILPDLERALAALVQADADHQAALAEYARVMAQEQGLRDQHALTIDKVMGQVRTAFPRDRASQDVIFPELDRRSRKSRSADEEDGTESIEEPS